MCLKILVHIVLKNWAIATGFIIMIILPNFSANIADTLSSNRILSRIGNKNLQKFDRFSVIYIGNI